MLVHARPRSPADATSARARTPRARHDPDGRRVQRIVGGLTERDFELAEWADRVVP